MTTTAFGVTATVHFTGSVIIISRRDGTEKMIPLSNLSAMQLKPKTFLGGNAYIEFTVGGAQERQHKLGGGGLKEMVAQVQSENVVIFTKKQQPQFIALRDAILEALRSG